MGDQPDISAGKGKGRRRIWLFVAIVVALLVIFHRPILLKTLHCYAVRAAAKENLRLEFRVEGNLFTALTIRNLHIVPTGPAAIEIADADYIRVEYGLVRLLRGRADFLDALEVRNARVVVDPAKTRIETTVRPNEKVTLPAIFPERARLADVSLVIRDPAHDFKAEHIWLDLNPRAPGELRIALLQLPTSEAWTRVSGTTTYENRDLILRDIVLNQTTRFPLVQIDASQINARKLDLRLSALLDGAPVEIQTSLREQDRSLLIKSHVSANQLTLTAAKKLGVFTAAPVQGTVEHFDFDFVGLLSNPRTWAASGGGAVRDLNVDGVSFDQAAWHVSAINGVAQIQPVTLVRAGANIGLSGTIQLPPKTSDLLRSPATFQISGDNLDLAPLTSAMPIPATGRAAVNGRAEIRDQMMTATIKVSGSSINHGHYGIDQFEAELTATKNLRFDPLKSPWFRGLEAKGSVSAKAIHGRRLLVDALEVKIASADDRVTITDATVQRGANTARAQGSVRFPANGKNLKTSTAEITATLSAPRVGEFWISDSPHRVIGAVDGYLAVNWNGRNANGSFNLDGSGLQLRKLTVPQLNAVGSIWQSKIFLHDLTANLNQRDYIRGVGTVELRGAKKFQGKLDVDIADLSTLKPVLEASGNNTELGGAFVLHWQGSGSAARLAENGSLKLAWTNGALGDMRKLQATADATYSPDELQIPTIFLGSDQMDFQAIASAKNGVLEITRIQLDQGKAKYASGYLSIPFLWRNFGSGASLFPDDGKVVASVQSENLDLKKLFDDFGLTPLATGTVSLTFEANGPLRDLPARLDVEASDLRNPNFEKLEPATLKLVAQTTSNELQVDGQLQQPNIQPVAISARMPFPVAEILQNKRIDENAPLQATVRLPRSSVNFLRQFVPAVDQLDGDLALDVAIGGSIAHPSLTGNGDIKINVARFSDESVPPVRSLNAKLVFRDNTITLDQLAGDLAGGPFTISGRIVFAKLTQPTIELQLRADSILIARNDSLTARADANLNVNGPLASATVTGNIALTDSHFLKDIDLIPIALPGRPAPHPFTERPDFAITDPPLRDWKFDVAVKTKDPVAFSGNLANGSAIVDLHLGGTGAHPELKGLVRMQNVVATLPFSRLEVTNGFLYFDPSDSFNPKIDLQGTSLIRDYTVRVYVYGSVLAPQAVFNSEPPLPQEEIISLLATGTTRAELTGNNSVLAGRAVMLVARQLYRKIFKRNQQPAQNTSTFFDRLQVDLGGVDPRTGQQQASARFKVNNNWVLVGDLGVGGEFRGMVKYLIRFH